MRVAKSAKPGWLAIGVGCGLIGGAYYYIWQVNMAAFIVSIVGCLLHLAALVQQGDGAGQGLPGGGGQEEEGQGNERFL